MQYILLKLLRIPSHGADRITDSSLSLHGSVGWVILIALILGVLAFYGYRLAAAHLSSGRRYLLAAIRVIFLLLLLLLLLRPTARFTLEGTAHQRLLLLVDGTGSMTIPDPRTNPPDVERAAIALGKLDPEKGLAQPIESSASAALAKIPRIDLVRGALKNDRLKLLPRLQKDYDVRAFQFGQKLDELTEPWAEQLSPSSPITPLGDAVCEMLTRSRGQSPAGIVLVTDGASNIGSQALDAAEMAGREKVPLYIWGVGVSSTKDIIVSDIYAPQHCFIKDQVNVIAHVQALGMKGQTVTMQLKLAGRVVDQAEVKFQHESEQFVPLKFTPTEAGDFELSAGIDPLPDEVSRDNNQKSQPIHVIDGKIKVLMIEQSPRWEFKFLQTMLLRDRRVQCSTWLIDGDPAIAQGLDTPYLPQFPAKIEDLNKYDVVIFGDVDPRSLTAGQIQMLDDFVDHFRGNLIVIAGRRFTPIGYRGTPIQKMLPVEWDDALMVGDTAGAPVSLQLTAAGKRNAMLRLVDGELANAETWSHLPPVYWAARVTRAKPGAAVLVVDPDPDKVYHDQKMPVVVTQQYNTGHVLFIGTDNLWRWRRNAGEQMHVSFWSQVVQCMALPHKLSASAKRIQIKLDKQNYFTGSPVMVYATLYNEAYQPIVEPLVRGMYGIEGRSPTLVQLRAVPQQPGRYRGEFVAPEPGRYHFWLERDEKTREDFKVTVANLEMEELLTMNEPGLREMARRSGGQFFREEDLYLLPERLKVKTEHIQSVLEVDLWSQPIYFVLLMLMVTAEWGMRKMWQLK